MEKKTGNSNGGKSPTAQSPDPLAEQKTVIRITDYSGKRLTEVPFGQLDECSAFLNNPKSVTWIDVVGLKNTEMLERIGKCFGLHPLVMEDIIHTRQRPKLEDYDKYLYMVVRMLFQDSNKKSVRSEQISIILGKSYVISFQEREGDVFSKVREYIRKDKGRLRRMGADFLAYSLLDAVVDNYFLILEAFGEKVEFVEESLIRMPDPKVLHSIRKLKKEILVLRRSVWPLREVVLALERESRSSKPLVGTETAIYLRDVYDHAVQVVDNVETYRDSMSGMFDIYLSSVSNRMNEIMKVLTIIGTIFIPLTFITGIYGMNFDYMPELEHPFGYFGTVGLMILVAGIMLLFFRRKKWL
ncbi:MAG: magnesium/cobalt transporter CorA [Candidatus Micrarchaeota archaeon]